MMSDKDSPCDGVDLNSWDESEERYVCAVDEDPVPSCESYESDDECPNCGVDLNNLECECEDL
jgi:hypothetical protein